MTTIPYSPAEWYLDSWLRLLTITKEEIVGQIVVFHAACDLLILRCPTQSNDGTFQIRMVKPAFLTNVTVLPSPPKELKNWTPYTVDAVSQKKTKQRESQAIQQAKKKFATIGVGVDATAQQIFDTLNKTYDCSTLMWYIILKTRL